MKSAALIFLLSMVGPAYSVQANEDHKEHKHEEGKEHGEHEGEGEAKNVGPNKGIISFDEHEGFVLSKEAFSNFKVELKALQGVAPWEMPKSSLVMTQDDVSVFRFRDGKFLRVDVSVVSKNSGVIRFRSDDLKSGDQVVIQGAGFLRVAELDVTSGETGHSH